MRIISRKKIKDFWEKAYPESEQALKAWFKECKNSIWINPHKIKEQYKNASILKNNRVVFNICGNKFRLVVKIDFIFKIVFIRFIGTHKEYDAIDAEKI